MIVSKLCSYSYEDQVFVWLQKLPEVGGIGADISTAIGDMLASDSRFFRELSIEGWCLRSEGEIDRKPYLKFK